MRFPFSLKILFFILIFSSCYSFAQNKLTASPVNIDTSIDKKYLIGDFDPAAETDFVLVNQKYSVKKNFYLRKEVYKAFIKMYNAALKDSVKLCIISATRNFDYQKRLWEEKWDGEKQVDGQNVSNYDSLPRVKMIMKYMTMPGTSRHHWGTDIDLNSADPDYYFTDEGDKLYKWLKANASKFGFCQPYVLNYNYKPFNIQEERWHWSYLPLAKVFLENYKAKVTYNDIKGFSGWEKAREIDIIKNYVMDINKNCY